MWLVAESMTDVYGEDGEDGDEDADEVTITTSPPFIRSSSDPIPVVQSKRNEHRSCGQLTPEQQKCG